MSRSVKRAPVWLGLVVTLALVAAACGGDDEPSTTGPTGESGATTGGAFSMSIGEPESLIPQINSESEGSQVLRALFTPLITFGENEEVIFAVAESIESDDNVTWTVTLRDGWTFHDGTPVTAQSFVDAWNWGAYGPNAAGNNYFFGPFGVNIVGYDAMNPTEGEPETDQLSGLTVVDDLTFTVELGAAFSEFPITVNYNAFYPLPESFFADPEAFNEAPVGNGPYMVDGDWQHDVGINLVRYEDYAGTPGNADAVEFRIYADLDTAFRDVQAGNLDIQHGLPPEQIGSAQSEFGERYFETPSSSFSYIGFPLWEEQFQNPDIRKAFSMAIDRQVVIDAIYFGTLTPADDMVSPVIQGYRTGVCQYCSFDPTAAKELFDAAGGFDGPLTIWFNNDGGHEQWIEAVSNMWRQNLGVEDITFESMPFAKYLGLLDQGFLGNFDEAVTGPFRLGWGMDYPSMQNYLENLHGTEAGSNYTTYSNPEVDDLIQQGKQADSLEGAIASHQEADDIILEDMPIIPLWFGLGTTVYSERVSNILVDKFAFVDIAAVQVVDE